MSVIVRMFKNIHQLIGKSIVFTISVNINYRNTPHFIQILIKWRDKSEILSLFC